MKKLLLILGFLTASLTSAFAWQQAPLNPQQCQPHAPWGIPQVAKPDAALICRQGYLLLHDNQAKIPAWVSWTVTPQTVNGCLPRTNAFSADQSLPPNKRATPSDYAGSGFDQGHLANDAHQNWSQQTGLESFLMTNMSPQLPGFNRGIWKLLETATGAWVHSRQTNLTVFAGNIYDVNNARKIGKGQVVVPNGLFKIIIDQRTGEHFAFLFPHKEGLGNDLGAVQSTIAEVEKYSGITFPFPPQLNKNLKAPLWPIDFKGVADAKRALCRQ